MRSGGQGAVTWCWSVMLRRSGCGHITSARELARFVVRMNGGDDETRTRDLCRDSNFTAPIATLGALRNPQEVLLHPYCTQIFGINSSPSRNHFHGKPTISLVIISQKPVCGQ